MDIQDLRQHLDSRLDRIEDRLGSKLEQHEVRIVKVEQNIGWARGAVRLLVSLIIAIVTSVGSVWYSIHTGGK